MQKNISVGIDIGTHEIKVMICEVGSAIDKGLPRVLGAGSSESRGLRRGYIISTGEVTNSIALAVKQAEKNSGIKIKKAYVSLGGAGLQSITALGSIMTSRADSEITELDVSKAISNSEKEIPKHLSINRKIIHTIPLQYKIDGQVILGRPHGLKAMKLEVKTLFITCLEQHINDLIQCIEELDIEVEDVIASSIATSLVTLSKIQKVAGCVLADIGAETVSIVVFENNIPISLEVFPLGGDDITNDIALGLKISLEEALSVKQNWENSDFSKKKIDEIVDARLSDIFELIENHLKKIGRYGLLPAGIIFVGGGSLTRGVEEFAKDSLKLPSKISTLHLIGNFKSPFQNIVFSSAYGLCFVGLTNVEEEQVGLKKGLTIAKSTTKGLVSWVKQFLP